MKILVIGHDARHIACSASRAGHDVMAADCYCDLDLVDSASMAVRLDCDPELPGDPGRAARDLMERALDDFDPDFAVLGPGLEEMGVKGVEVLNNPSRKVSLVSDKLWLARWLERKGYPSVQTWMPSDVDWSGDRPLMAKPRKGAGGWKNRLVLCEEELEGLDEEVIVQEWVEGEPASVSLVGCGNEAVAISVNEQLIGEHWLGAEGFRYCGNVTPLDSQASGHMVEIAEMTEMAENIGADLGLLGSNGVDFLLTPEGPLVLEVNPRFQGSLDSVELSTGMNVFQAHLGSFEGTLPERPEPLRTAARAIVFAEDDLKITEDLREVTVWVADVPRPGTAVKKGDPLISILAAGKSRDIVMNLLQSRSSAVRHGCPRA